MENNGYLFFPTFVLIGFINDYDILGWGLTYSQWPRVELIFFHLFSIAGSLCWITMLITPNSETHFLSTSHCLILSAMLLWAEMLGIGNTSRNYTRGEVSKRRLKQTASSIGSSCMCSTLLPVAARVYFCATSPAFRLRVVKHCRHGTVCPDTWPQIHLWPSHFPLLRRVLQMCMTFWVRTPRNVFVWGKRKKRSGCVFSYWLDSLLLFGADVVAC